MNEQNFLDLLKENLKKAGLPLAEELAEECYKAVSATAVQYAAASSNTLLKAIVPAAMKALDELAFSLIEKIDKSDNPVAGTSEPVQA